MSANPHANGGIVAAPSGLPDFQSYAVQVPKPGRRRPKPRGCSADFCAT